MKRNVFHMSYERSLIEVTTILSPEDQLKTLLLSTSYNDREIENKECTDYHFHGKKKHSYYAAVITL